MSFFQKNKRNAQIHIDTCAAYKTPATGKLAISSEQESWLHFVHELLGNKHRATRKQCCMCQTLLASSVNLLELTQNLVVAVRYCGVGVGQVHVM